MNLQWNDNLWQFVGAEVYKCKEKFVILKSIGIIAIKVVKQGQSSTPADIPVDIFNP